MFANISTLAPVQNNSLQFVSNHGHYKRESIIFQRIVMIMLWKVHECVIIARWPTPLKSNGIIFVSERVQHSLPITLRSFLPFLQTLAWIKSKGIGCTSTPTPTASFWEKCQINVHFPDSVLMNSGTDYRRLTSAVSQTVNQWFISCWEQFHVSHLERHTLDTPTYFQSPFSQSHVVFI